VVRADAVAPAGDPGTSDILPVGCSSCGGGLLGGLPAPTLGAGPDGVPGGGPGGGCACGCGCGVPCHAGRVPCDCCDGGGNCFTKFFYGVYQCICCNDPCYEPAWVPLANAALFVDPVRPATQIRLRGDFAGQYQFPDKAEYFWAQENARGPHFAGTVPPGTKAPGSPNLDYTMGSLYNEVAVNNFSFFVELTYLNIEPILYPGDSGFGDMNLGTKTMFLDCELIQSTFQFKTFLPTGNAGHGVGTGHVSLEPALLTSIKLTPITYFQWETAFWFPLGGTASFQGPLFHYHLSLNQLLCHCGKDIQLIGTAELNGYDFTDGSYTSPLTGLPASVKAVTNIVNLGPGLRLSICNKFDMGAGGVFAISKDRMAEAMARLEMRYRF
jgi:hypothetical protein